LDDCLIFVGQHSDDGSAFVERHDVDFRTGRQVDKHVAVGLGDLAVGAAMLNWKIRFLVVLLMLALLVLLAGVVMLLAMPAG